ncbi:tRNA dihydrouridine synthase DusB [Marinicella gelatinilytica]|uniref:tRNA dihydrouridine synthase DusB n=1 Tax=Marinicella gelatinilytica TaxID=2996017 RepID=UPI002260CEDA|nr:tRNA dihydrouridine synthase DusB [Marinicella gelatinilytica]MCX7544612.1 tRNA dihydrouridine synthase DusB [Marinicella gelatinilytica]
MSFHIGPYPIEHPVMLAPMAGVTDRPYRQLCKELGASYAVGEMLSCDLSLLKTAKTRFRMNHDGEPGPIAVQIAGSDPKAMAEAAIHNVNNGAQIIDINMGCPQKKVAKKRCGSALMAYPEQIRAICEAVVDAVTVPVTLKTRLGTDSDHLNIERIAEDAEAAGISALFVHGRTQQQKYTGQADYALIKAVKQQLSIPVIANGDIDSPEKARWVINYTGCDGLMIGRAAQGNPWIFKQILAHLRNEQTIMSPTASEIMTTLYQHVLNLQTFYGLQRGCRMAKKHIKWFSANLPAELQSRQLLVIDDGVEQLRFIEQNLLSKVA